MLIKKKEVPKVKLMLWFQNKGREFQTRGGWRDQRGDVDIGGILLMGIGMVFLAVGFIVYPIIMDATDDLLEWACTDCTSITYATFTGFAAVVGITPLLVLIGYLSAAVFTMYLGIRVMKGVGSTNLNLGTLILLALSLIFIAIALIILPVALEGICSVLEGDEGSSGISATYVGLEAILKVTPLLILISFIGGAVVAGFFGIKRLGAG